MSKFVRVELENGAKATIGAALAKATGLKPLKEDAVDHRGRPLPEQYPEKKDSAKPSQGSQPAADDNTQPAAS